MPFAGRELGADRTDDIVNSDGQMAIKTAAGDVAALRPSVRMIREDSLGGYSRTNGIVESSIQSATHQTKVLKY